MTDSGKTSKVKKAQRQILFWRVVADITPL